MCQFFSLNSDGEANLFYFDSEIRKKIMREKLDYDTDSHTSIADYFGFKGAKEDKLNKYEYNPLTKKFKIDQLNNKDDSKEVEQKCRKLDFSKIVPELIIKPIINPFTDKHRKRVTKKDIEKLKKWNSVYDSVCASVGASVRASVGASVEDSVRASVWDSVGDYISSFFKLTEWKYIKHKKGENPFQSCIDLWESGLVPSFDGKTWRLHGENGKVLYEHTHLARIRNDL